MVEIVPQKLAIAEGIQQDVHPTLQEDTVSTLATYCRPTLEKDEDVQLPLQENIHPTRAEDAQTGRNLVDHQSLFQAVEDHQPEARLAQRQ